MKLKKLWIALPIAAIIACTGAQSVLAAHASGEEDPLPQTQATFVKEHWHFNFSYDKQEMIDSCDVRPVPLPYYPDCPGNHTKPTPMPDFLCPGTPNPDAPTPYPMPRPLRG